MSAPPTSSPLTKTCGIVGQPEIAERSCADLRVRENVDRRDGCAGTAKRLQRPVRVAAHHELRRALHEERDVRAVDDVLDLVAVAHCRSPSS